MMQMMNPFLRLTGVLATAICGIAYFYFAHANPDFRHLTKAFSELSSTGAPGNLSAAFWLFFLPGLLVTIFFIKLPSCIRAEKLKRYPFVLLMLSGLLTMLGTSPMNYYDFTALSSQVHIVGVMGGGFAFMIGAFTISRQLKKDQRWAGLTKPLLVLAWVLVVSGFFRESSFPGLAQKLGIFAYYLYASLLSWNAFRLLRKNRSNKAV